ncbi:MAG TPA: retropepsin-like aspartic protease, partial [Chthoniobacterales bacterium]|nr:retropepsin-like aspartic protease [Chthoniobacterales bacterium]
MKFGARESVAKLGLSILAAFAFALNASAATSRPATIGDRFEVLPLTRSWQNHLLVHVRVNGKPAVLMVDSGAPATLINSKRRADFHIERIGAGSGLPTSVIVNGVADSLAILHNLRLGALSIVDLPVVLTKVSSPPRVAKMVREQEIDGILGVDVLFATKAVLDCQDQVLILNRYPELGGAETALNLNGFQKMPIYVSEGYNLFVNSAI